MNFPNLSRKQKKERTCRIFALRSSSSFPTLSSHFQFPLSIKSLINLVISANLSLIIPLTLTFVQRLCISPWIETPVELGSSALPSLIRSNRTSLTSLISSPRICPRPNPRTTSLRSTRIRSFPAPGRRGNRIRASAEARASAKRLAFYGAPAAMV